MDAREVVRREVLSLLFATYAQYLERELGLEAWDGEVYHLRERLRKVEGDVWKRLQESAERYNVPAKLLAKESFKNVLSFANEEITKVFSEKGLEGLRDFVWAGFERDGFVLNVHAGAIYTLLEEELKREASKLTAKEITKEDFLKVFEEILPGRSEGLEKFADALWEAERKFAEALKDLDFQEVARSLKKTGLGLRR